jgi:hypothetical protein
MTWESMDYSLEYCWTWKDLCSTSLGSIALDPYTRENGVRPVDRLVVVNRAHRTDGGSFIHFPILGFNLSKMLGFNPCKITSLDHLTCPLLCGCEMEA